MMATTIILIPCSILVRKTRGLLVRYEKKSANYLGLLQFACALLWYRRVPGPGAFS